MSKQQNQSTQIEQRKDFEQITSMHAGTIIHTKIFDGANRMVTLGNDGQIHLYARQLNQWNHKCMSKLFDSSIVNYDLLNIFGQSYLAAASYAGQIKICRLDQEEIIVQQQFQGKLQSPIVSCVWGATSNQIIITSQLGEVGFINRQDNNSVYDFQISDKSQKITPILARQGNKATFICCKNQLDIIELVITQLSKSTLRSSVLKLDSNIIDFAVSKEPSFCSLIVVTQHQLLFYIMLGRQTIETCEFDIDHRSLGTRLGWGSTQDQIGLYQCINGSINIRIFRKMKNGTWYEEFIDKKLKKNDMNDQ